jgi:nucleotide-binding universal stress UspA family protein
MKILLALDPFGSSRKAFEEALRLTKLQSAELIIMAIAETFHDKEHSYVGVPGGPEALVPVVQQKMAEAESLALKDGVTPKIIIEKGEGPVQGIITRAHEEKVDLIIMGHRERHGLDLFVLGSVATKVVNNAHCSVLVVR